MDGKHYFWDSLRYIAYFPLQSFQMIYGDFPIYETFIKYNKTKLLKTWNKKNKI